MSLGERIKKYGREPEYTEDKNIIPEKTNSFLKN